MRSRIALIILGLTLTLCARAQTPEPKVSPALHGGGMQVVSQPTPSVRQPCQALQRLVAPVAQKCARGIPGWGEALGQVLMKMAWFGDLLLSLVGFWGLLGFLAGLCLAVNHWTQGMCRT